jgi:hypothetical protein
VRSAREEGEGGEAHFLVFGFGDDEEDGGGRRWEEGGGRRRRK